MNDLGEKKSRLKKAVDRQTKEKAKESGGR